MVSGLNLVGRQEQSIANLVRQPEISISCCSYLPLTYPPSKNWGLSRAYWPLVSLNKALLKPYFWGETLGGAYRWDDWLVGVFQLVLYL